MPSAAPRILLTGFEPFGGQRLNPSWEVARALDGAVLGAARVHSLQLPCAFDASLQVLHGALQRLQPDVVLALGQAEGRADVSIERVAINVQDARMPDNTGAQPVDVPVVDGAPAAYFSTLPIKRLVQALRGAGLPASVSQTAGTFVCNHVFYGLQHALAGRGARSGFIHLPLLPEQAAVWPGATPPSLSLALQVAAIRCVLQTLLDHEGADVPVGAGALN